jgi:prepilin signal peptidase PulO-like enzyme (type II secretory pathway)
MSSNAEVQVVDKSDEASPWTVRIPPGIVAVVAIGLAAGSLIHFDLAGRAFVAAGFCIVLTVLAAIDLERRIIPNRIVVPAGIAVLIADIAVEPDRAREWVIAACAAGGGAFVVAVAARGGFGMGDVKLCFLLGAGLGWGVLGALVIGVFAGAVAALAVLARHGLEARKTTIPYGPFLAFGAILMLFLS